MKINWKARLKNKFFVASAISAFILVIQAITAIFGFTIDLGDVGNKILVAVDAIFAFLVILGVVNDPTTSGVSDSSQALTYSKPREDSKDGKG